VGEESKKDSSVDRGGKESVIPEESSIRTHHGREPPSRTIVGAVLCKKKKKLGKIKSIEGRGRPRRAKKGKGQFEKNFALQKTRAQEAANGEKKIQDREKCFYFI